MNTKCRRRGAFSLVDLMVGMAIASIVLTSILVGSFSLQRSFEAANYRMSAQDDQLRMLDYITRDAHAASGVSIVEGNTRLNLTLPAVSTSSVDLTLPAALPNPSDLSFGPLLTPLVAAATPVTPPAMPSAISYYVEGGQLVREVNSVQNVIADTIADVNFTRTGSYVSIDVTFTPQYSNSPTLASQPATRASCRALLFNLSAAN